MHRSPDIDLIGSISGKVARAQQTSGNARCEQLSIPDAVVFISD